MKIKCEYFHDYDDTENMHKDKYTEEHYHKRCRPVKTGIYKF